ncbi:MAG: hypothetical protein ACXWPM_12365 [Bdellovibrionota bacterium]
MTKLRAALVAMGITGAFFASLTAISQNTDPSPSPSASVSASASITPETQVRVAQSSVDQNHNHALMLTDAEISSILSGMSSDTDSITLESSTNYDNGAANGILHSHTVTLNRPALQALQSGLEVIVVSGASQGHTHRFKFVRAQDCPGIVIASPSPSASASASPSPSATPSGSPSPSGVPLM